MFVNPQQVIAYLELSPGMTAADFGCGAGHYAIPLARAVGSTGKVYAYDIRKEALEMTRSQARLERLLNIEAIWANLEMPGSTKLANETIDAVVFSNVLFQAEDKKAIVTEAARITKKDGRVMIIEWDETKGIGGPPMQDRVSRQEAKRLLADAGFSFEKEFNAGDQHYGLLFRKP